MSINILNLIVFKDSENYKKREKKDEYDYSSTPKDFLSKSAFTNPSL